MWYFTFLLNNMWIIWFKCYAMQSLPWHIQRTPSLISSNCITVQQTFFHSRVTVLHHLSSQCPAHLLHCVWQQQQQMTWKKAKDFEHCFFLWYISWNDWASKTHKWNEWLTWNHKSMHNLSQHTHFGQTCLSLKLEQQEDKVNLRLTSCQLILVNSSFLA